MRKLTRAEIALVALPLLVPATLWLARAASRPLHSAHLKNADMVGIYQAQTSEGKQTLTLESSGNIKCVLVIHGGYTYKQNTGSWKLFKHNGGKWIDLWGLLYYDNGHPGVMGNGFPIEDVEGKIIIHSADGDYEKQ